MKIVAQPDTSGNILTSNPRSLPNNGDFAAGYLLLNPHEIDPNPGELPPSFRDELQAALNAQRRGFELIQLGPDGTPLAADWRSEGRQTTPSSANAGPVRLGRRLAGSLTA